MPITVGKFILTEHTEIWLGMDQFLKNKYRPKVKIIIPAFWDKNPSIYWHHMAAYYRKTPVLEFQSIAKNFKSTYFEEHLRTVASENVFMKLRKINL